MGQKETKPLLIAPPCSYDLSLPHLKFIQTKEGIITPILEIKPKHSKATILYAHEFTADLGMIHDHLVDISDTLSVTVISYDYPGFGMTKEDVCSFESAVTSSFATLAYVLKQHKNILLIGRKEGSFLIEKMSIKKPCFFCLYQEPITKLNCHGLVIHSPDLSSMIEPLQTVIEKEFSE